MESGFRAEKQREARKDEIENGRQIRNNTETKQKFFLQRQMLALK